MKIAFAGGTGFIGAEVLRQCLQHPGITEVVALSRRNLSDALTKSPKLKTVIVDSFESFSDDVIEELAGAEGCVWAIGGMVHKFNDITTARKANIDWPVAFAQLFMSNSTLQLPGGKRFRFVFTSGAMTNRDLENKPWFLGDSRNMKGEVETKLLAIQNQHVDTFEVFFPRPAGVLETNTGVQNFLMGNFAVGKEELAASMTDIIVHGWKEQVIENAVLKSHGRSLLSEMK